jgi:hypothetical protein
MSLIVDSITKRFGRFAALNGVSTMRCSGT